MIVVAEILLALAVVAVVVWAWACTGRSRVGLALAAGVLAAFFGPWLAAADWGVLARVTLVAALAGALVGGYAWGLARLRRAARERDGE